MPSDHLDRWTSRFEALRSIYDDLIAAGHYDQASRASRLLQRAYERWAHEVFSHRAA